MAHQKQVLALEGLLESSDWVFQGFDMCGRVSNMILHLSSSQTSKNVIRDFGRFC